MVAKKAPKDDMRRLAGLTKLIAVAVSILLYAAAPVHAQKGKAAKVDLNFVDVDISSMVRIMSDITGKNFIFDEGLKGQITIIAPVKLTSDEAFSLFVSALQLKNYALIPAGKAYKIVPAAQARQNPAKVLTGAQRAKAAESYIIRVVPLKYVSTQEAFPFVQPLISRFGQISVFGSRNAIMIVDTAINVEKILDVLATVDTEPDIDEPEVTYLKHSRADTIAGILKAEASRSGVTPAKGPGGQPGDDGITPDERLNAIILSGPRATREYLKRFIAVLDIPPPVASSRINVYYLENADSVEISRVLQDLIKASNGSASKGASAGPGGIGGDISITPDKATNALIVMASPADYQGLVNVIKQLDRRPKQVFVEAMITEVKIDKALDLGTKWRVTGEKGGEPVAIGGVGTVDSSAIQTIINGMAGLAVGGLGNFITVPVTGPDGSTFNLTAPGFAVLFSLSQFKDVVNVLSTPHILTSDNSEAEIIVGENVPFLSKIEREGTTAAQPVLQSIERKDVGIKLRIKPKISEGDFVKLEIYQEISAVSPTTTVGASDLITSKRSASTSVVVKNNQTVVIGGLIQDREIKSTTKVPILGDIPLLKWLFRFNSDKREKTNLLVFITPYIIDDFRALEEIKARKQEEFDKGAVRPSEKKDQPPSAAPVEPEADEPAPVEPAPEESVEPEAVEPEPVEPSEPAPEEPAEKEPAPAEPGAKGPDTDGALKEDAGVSPDEEMVYGYSEPSAEETAAGEGQPPADEAGASAMNPAPPPSPVTTGIMDSPIEVEPLPTDAVPQPVFDIIDVRTGMHRDFHRLVVELSGTSEYKVEETATTLKLRMRRARITGPLKKNLSTSEIFVRGLTEFIDDKGRGAIIEAAFKDGTEVKRLIRYEPFRIILDFYPKR